MTDEEFIRELRRLVDEAWDNGRLLGWFVASAALAGARLGAWIRRDRG